MTESGSKSKPRSTHRCVSIITLRRGPFLLWLLWTGAVGAGWSVQGWSLISFCFCQDVQQEMQCSFVGILKQGVTIFANLNKGIAFGMLSKFVKEEISICVFSRWTFSPVSIRASCLGQLGSTTTTTAPRLLNLSKSDAFLRFFWSFRMKWCLSIELFLEDKSESGITLKGRGSKKNTFLVVFYY